MGKRNGSVKLDAKQGELVIALCESRIKYLRSQATWRASEIAMATVPYFQIINKLRGVSDGGSDANTR